MGKNLEEIIRKKDQEIAELQNRIDSAIACCWGGHEQNNLEKLPQDVIDILQSKDRFNRIVSDTFEIARKIRREEWGFDDVPENDSLREAKIVDNSNSNWSMEGLAGLPVKIEWCGDFDDMVDRDYIMFLPGYPSSDFHIVIHIPSPDNPGGKDQCDPEWYTLTDLVNNPNIGKIIIGKL